MGVGHFVRVGDRTTCGGKVLSGDSKYSIGNVAVARTGDKVMCGKDGKVYTIAGGIPTEISHGQLMAGTLHSRSTCSCHASFIPSLLNATYYFDSSTPITRVSSNTQIKEEKHAESNNFQQGIKNQQNNIVEKEKQHFTTEIILITSTLIESYTEYEVFGDHSAIYFTVQNDTSSPYLYDPNGSYNPDSKIDSLAVRGSGFFFSGEQANLDNFIAYQQNPTQKSKSERENEWFPYKVKLTSIPVTEEEIKLLLIKAYELDNDPVDKPDSVGCAKWCSKLLQVIEPQLDIYTLPNNLWEAVVEIRNRRLNSESTI
ncbi:MAG: PAAR domain-containing protein [Enterobacteriaceae bacterium]|jgi:uncharacterized Zn-binding protein involved in type VI secretion|nr:PAAR domain-containing protein [Enterobacteriaceae bacterium]